MTDGGYNRAKLSLHRNELEIFVFIARVRLKTETAVHDALPCISRRLPIRPVEDGGHPVTQARHADLARTPFDILKLAGDDTPDRSRFLFESKNRSFDLPPPTMVGPSRSSRGGR